MKRLTVGSLFSGIGGIDLGLQRAGMEIRWHAETDRYASRVLEKHWPGIPNHGDVTQIDFRRVERVQVLAGGFPCQDISNAGKREGIDGEQSGLWTDFRRAIGEIRPAYVFVENVAAILTRGAGRVLGDLAALGYDAEWDCIPAAAVGAPHLRDRWYMVAYARIQQQPAEQSVPFPGSRNAVDAARDGASREMADPNRAGRQKLFPSTVAARARLRSRCRDAERRYWAVEPNVGRVANGIPARLDRLRGLGNAVVPQIPEIIGGWIIEHARATGYMDSAA